MSLIIIDESTEDMIRYLTADACGFSVSQRARREGKSGRGLPSTATVSESTISNGDILINVLIS